MKSGYYLTESGKFQVWYPPENGRQRFDIVHHDGSMETVYTDTHTSILIWFVYEYEFIGDL